VQLQRLMWMLPARIRKQIMAELEPADLAEASQARAKANRRG
jgi:hypothetical protein